jgi:DNA-directed RNA polymerase specialized sigma24 family protein
MKHEEASEIMQLSIKAIESLLSRAKENLKNKLKNYYNS